MTHPNPNLPPELEPLREVAAVAISQHTWATVVYDNCDDADDFAEMPAYIQDIYRKAADAVLLAIAPRIQEMVAAQDHTAAVWRNGITNTAALIDRVRNGHRPRHDNKAFAAFDAELNDPIEKWFSFSRGVSPTTWAESEAEWKRFLKIVAPPTIRGGEHG